MQAAWSVNIGEDARHPEHSMMMGSFIIKSG